MRSHTRSLALALALAAAVPAAARAADAADLPALEQAWHGCVRGAFESQPEQAGKVSRERTALAACKAHEDAYVAALMAARPDDDQLLIGWSKTLAAYVAFVVDPVAAWIEKLRR